MKMPLTLFHHFFLCLFRGFDVKGHLDGNLGQISPFLSTFPSDFLHFLGAIYFFLQRRTLRMIWRKDLFIPLFSCPQMKQMGSKSHCHVVDAVLFSADF